MYDQPIPGTVMHDGNDTRWFDDILFSSPTVSLHNEIRQFSNLRSLKSSPAIFHPNIFPVLLEARCWRSKHD
ncbi:hypothetical protein BDV93DRAFT_309848 [Ceratobasidium sp. AG-I]|nr:hypothetical protein BDV93DRAFT_309848 [Ceratobasidium sp. AG-I]